MRDFYRAAQEKEQPIPSFANRIEGLLSKIREKFPKHIPFHKEQMTQRLPSMEAERVLGTVLSIAMLTLGLST